MKLYSIAWRYITSGGWGVVAAVISISLSTFLIATLSTVSGQVRDLFRKDASLVDVVVGGKGSPLQLTLSSVYHMDYPPGNILYNDFLTLKEDKRVKQAVAYGLGDNYQGHRIVGVTEGFFELKDTQRKETLFSVAEGRAFQKSFEVVLGHRVAKATKLKLGDNFSGVHGLSVLAGSESHDDFPFTVVGILRPTGTAQDKAIFTPIESVWQVHDKEKAFHHSYKEEEPKEVSAVLVQLESAGMRLWFTSEIAKAMNVMVAVPMNEIFRLEQVFIQPMQKVLTTVNLFVLVISILSVCLVISQLVERSRKEIAIMRCLGASQREVFSIVLFKTVFVTGCGILIGVLFSHFGIALAKGVVNSQTGLSLNPFIFSKSELLGVIIIFSTALIAGIVPAMKAKKRSPVGDL